MTIECPYQMRIATSRFWNKKAIEKSGLAPVVTSRGLPRWPVSYEFAGAVGMLTPYGLSKVEDRDEFELHYVARLEKYGVDKIGRVLEALAAGVDAPGVVLLCFENLEEPGTWCHRRTFAAWWAHQTGQEVPELAAPQLELGEAGFDL